QPDLMPVPPNLVPEFMVQPQDGLVVSPQEKRPFFSRLVVVWNPFHLVAGFCVADSVAIRPHFSGFDWIGRLGLRPASPWTRTMFSQEVSVQFLDLGHQVGIEGKDLNSGTAKSELAATAYPIIRIQSPYNDPLDSPLYYPIDTRNLGVV